jgi:hypothetical protein
LAPSSSHLLKCSCCFLIVAVLVIPSTILLLTWVYRLVVKNFVSRPHHFILPYLIYLFSPISSISPSPKPVTIYQSNWSIYLYHKS